MKTNKQATTGFFVYWYRQVIYAWRHVFMDINRHRLSTLLTLFVIAISITLPTVCYLLWKNASHALAEWSPIPTITVYLNKQLDEDQTKQLNLEIKKLPQIESLEYHSRQQTLREFKHWSGFNHVLDLLGTNPLPAIFILTPKNGSRDPQTLRELRTKMNTFSGIDDVRIDDSWFTRLMALTDLVSSVVWALSVLMIMAVSLVIGNSVRLMIFARRQTIVIMQLNGATEGFILRPFLYSGMLHGVISTFFALILTQIFIFRVDTIILSASEILRSPFVLNGLSLDEGIFILFVATILGWFSAWIATWKYLQGRKTARD